MSLSVHILKVIIFISHGYFTEVDVEVVVQSISYGDNIYYKDFSTAFGSGRKKIARSKMELPSIIIIPAFFKALCAEDRAQRLLNVDWMMMMTRRMTILMKLFLNQEKFFVQRILFSW